MAECGRDGTQNRDYNPDTPRIYSGQDGNAASITHSLGETAGEIAATRAC